MLKSFARKDQLSWFCEEEGDNEVTTNALVHGKSGVRGACQMQNKGHKLEALVSRSSWPYSQTRTAGGPNTELQLFVVWRSICSVFSIVVNQWDDNQINIEKVSDNVNIDITMRGT